jgi:arylsulfatase A-like enzyme
MIKIIINGYKNKCETLVFKIKEMNNAKFKRYLSMTLLSMAGISTIQCERPNEEKMNVLFIVVDDLNDWVGCFGGNPQVKTPNMGRLAAENSAIFMNAQAAATVCGPSRSALLTGLRPSTSGVYSNRENLRHSEKASQVLTIPQYFSANGYTSISTGKIFHKHPGKPDRDHGQWAFDVWQLESAGKWAPQSQSNLPYYEIQGTKMDWGPDLSEKEETKDWMSAEWIAGKLREEHTNPFFMMLGISKPHLSWFVPQEYFDLYNLDSIKVPDYLEDDLADILTPDGNQRFEPSKEFLVIRDNNKMKDAARAYMACVSYADDCVGVALDALWNSKYKDNTIVILIGDHGWHLGEKLKYRKNNAWEEDCRAPMIIHIPGSKESSRIDATISFMDIYPTLAELCGLPVPSHCEGQSLVPLFKNPKMNWEPALTTIGYKIHSVRSSQYRYIVYEDGTEELYDHKVDPMEWNNLVRESQYAGIVKDLRKYLPEDDAEPSGADEESGESD